MDFSGFLQALQDNTDVFSTSDVVFSTVLSFLLSLIIAYVYKITYKGVSYTQSYVHTLIMMSMVVSVIMLVIGSNIARAFSLVGALSIIRFRNAVKDTRDVGYIFFAMAIGMATGTRFYLVAIVATVVISFILWGMSTLNMFAKDVREQILKIRVSADMRQEVLFEQVFDRYLNRYNLIATETVQAGTLTEYIYGIELKRQQDAAEFMRELSKLNNNNKVALITGHHEVDL
ncbi:MAG TPA: DUF4956 domain-containing protein [Anaerolineae bacterium]|nr:DUF4956 domain-containing protein [Anaerolineae bacterium]HMR67033.1 DUF4956 domain-containing protein [Anaerolineae bacterium]